MFVRTLDTISCIGSQARKVSVPALGAITGGALCYLCDLDSTGLPPAFTALLAGRVAEKFFAKERETPEWRDNYFLYSALATSVVTLDSLALGHGIFFNAIFLGACSILKIVALGNGTSKEDKERIFQNMKVVVLGEFIGWLGGGLPLFYNGGVPLGFHIADLAQKYLAWNEEKLKQE